MARPAALLSVLLGEHEFAYLVLPHLRLLDQLRLAAACTASRVALRGFSRAWDEQLARLCGAAVDGALAGGCALRMAAFDGIDFAYLRDSSWHTARPHDVPIMTLERRPSGPSGPSGAAAARCHAFECAVLRDGFVHQRPGGAPLVDPVAFAELRTLAAIPGAAAAWTLLPEAKEAGVGHVRHASGLRKDVIARAEIATSNPRVRMEAIGSLALPDAPAARLRGAFVHMKQLRVYVEPTTLTRAMRERSGVALARRRARAPGDAAGFATAVCID